MNESRTRVVGDTVVEGRLLSVNVGTVRQIELAGQARTTAIWKLPVSGRVAVRGVNLAGDDQADRRAVDDLIRAVRSRRPERTADSILFQSAQTLHDVMQQMADTDLVVATRYHNVVCALRMGRPTI